MNKLLVICGPTATGKTKLAFELAKKFNGELISADSRQVYKGMDIGTGKDGSAWLYNVVSPDEFFSVADYHKLAWQAINNIWKRGKLPIIVGGTGLYIKAIIDGVSTLGIPPNEKLRSELEKISLSDLQTRLKKLNLEKWNLMNNSDRNNKRRLVRAIEITNRIKNYDLRFKKKSFDCLFIGLTADKEELYKRIDERVEKRVGQGIIKEIQGLLDKGYNWNLPAMSGLGYKQWREYFESSASKDTIIQKWKLAEHQYAKRQLTWFKKDNRINWFDTAKKDFPKMIVAKVASWYL